MQFLNLQELVDEFVGLTILQADPVTIDAKRQQLLLEVEKHRTHASLPPMTSHELKAKRVAFKIVTTCANITLHPAQKEEMVVAMKKIKQALDSAKPPKAAAETTKKRASTASQLETSPLETEED
jgi:hypothetical protein